MPCQVLGGVQYFLRTGLYPLPTVTSRGEGSHGRRHPGPVNRLFDVEPIPESSEDTPVVMGKLPGTGVFRVANNGERLLRQAVLGFTQSLLNSQ
jgi:hypothetical protein